MLLVLIGGATVLLMVKYLVETFAVVVIVSQRRDVGAIQRIEVIVSYSLLSFYFFSVDFSMRFFKIIEDSIR